MIPRVAITLAFVVLGLLVTIAGSAKRESWQKVNDRKTVEEQIRQIEDEWGQAYVNGNPEPIRRYVADDFVGIYPTRRQTKQDLLSALRPEHPTRTLWVKSKALAVRVYDKTAIAQGETAYELQSKTGSTVYTTTFTEVFILRGRHWQCVAGHYTPVVIPK